MRNFATGIILLICFSCISYELQAQDGFYFSPGIKFGGQSGVGLSVTFKFSFGVFKEVDGHLAFANLTFAKRNASSHKTFQKISFIKIQGELDYLNAGYGFGTAKTPNGELPVKIISGSIGYLYYLEIDHIMRSDGETFADIGLSLVAPIPLGLKKPVTLD